MWFSSALGLSHTEEIPDAHGLCPHLAGVQSLPSPAVCMNLALIKGHGVAGGGLASRQGASEPPEHPGNQKVSSLEKAGHTGLPRPVSHRTL